MLDMGPSTAFSDKVHAEKYRSKGETFREAMYRIASALSDNKDHFDSLRNILLTQRFLPGGRIQAAIGSTKAITPYNCYVSGTIADSYTEGSGSIMARAREAAITMRQGGGIGYDFSTLRPRGALIKKLHSRSSGPVPFMEIFNAVCHATSSSGHRRGAQMGVLRVDHPDIEEFVRAKQNETELTGFNISIAVTDKFMEAVEKGLPFTLTFDGQPYRDIDARTLWNTIMRSTYDWAEPGVLFIDTINDRNNLYYCETISATNPCGEQPLPPYGACLLGSFNLVKYIKRPDKFSNYEFDWAQLYLDVPHVVRAMDNVIDIARYPLHEQEEEAHTKRRMGLGVTGVANALEALGSKYGDDHFINLLQLVLTNIRDAAYNTSIQLAREKGAFPQYRRNQYTSGRFITTLPEETQENLYRYGIRNSHLLSIAPTGTISICADNVSSGLEPVFFYEADRTLIEFDGPKVYRVKDYGKAVLGVQGRTSEEVTIDQHLAVLITASQYVDSAVSKTCNVPTNYPWDDFKKVYFKAWEAGCKGCTTYRPGCNRGGVIEKAVDEKTESAPVIDPSCAIDPLTGVRSCE